MLKIINHYRRHGGMTFLGRHNHRAHFQCACGEWMSAWVLFG